MNGSLPRLPSDETARPAQSATDRRPTLHVAFAGGGARGYAHVGLLQAIEALGLRIVEVSGASIGAFVAALVAHGLRAADVGRLATTVPPRDFLAARPVLRRLVPCLGWGDRPSGALAGRLAPYVRTVQTVLGSVCFRDLPMPCVIQAADLTRGHRVWLSAAHHPDMPVALAVQAAAAVPGIATPVVWQGHQLADGGPAVRLPRLTIRADWIVVSSLDPARPLTGRQTGWGRRLAAAFHHHGDSGPGAGPVPVAPSRPVQGRPVTIVHAPDRLAQLGLFGVPRAGRVAALIEEATAAAHATLVQRIGLPDA